MGGNTLNGSVGLLAKAMRKVFSEAMEGAGLHVAQDDAMCYEMATKTDMETCAPPPGIRENPCPSG